ncbi:hypothetical protein ACLH7C_000896 [Campylobacter upsaliensis]
MWSIARENLINLEILYMLILFSNEKESRYSDDEICNLEFHF